MLASKHLQTWHLLGVIALGIGLRITVFSGYNGSDIEFFDDSIYVANAFQTAEGRTVPTWAHWQARLGMTGPLAVVLNVLPRSILSVALLPFLWSAVGIPLAYAIGKYFYDDHGIALMGSLFVAVIPLHVVMASLYYPAMALAALLGVAFLSFAAAESRGRKLLYLVAGLALGLAYLHRVTALFALLPAILWCAYSRRIRVGYLVAGGGFVAVLIAEALASNYLWGDPLYRFHVLFDVAAGFQGHAHQVAIRPGGALFAPIVSLLTNDEYGFFYYFVVWAIIGLLWKRDKVSAPLLLFTLAVGIYTLWGTMSPTVYNPLRPWPRYMASVTIPAALLLARWLIVYQRPIVRNASVAVLVVSSIACAYLDNSHTARSLGTALHRVHETDGPTTLVVPAPAYMHMFMTNGLEPPKNVEILGKGGSPGALRIDPSLTLRMEEEELSGCLVAVSINRETPVPDHWQHRSRCLRTRQWHARYLEAAGGIFARLAEKLEPVEGFDVYYVPAKEERSEVSRVPFLDHRLVEFVCQLPVQYKLKGFQTKRLLRVALGDTIPREIVTRGKKGFPTPTREWFRSDYHPVMQKLLTSPDSLSREYIRPEYVKRILHDHQSGRWNLEEQIWTLGNLEIWLRVVIDGQDPQTLFDDFQEVRACA